MYIDTPEVRAIVARAFPNYNGRKFEVKPFQGPMRLDSCWSGGSKESFRFVSMTGEQTATVPENGTPWSNDGKIAQCTELPLNVALVEHTIFCGKDMGCTVYVHPDNLNRMALPAPVELSQCDKIVLAATAGLKPSYNGIKNFRFHEANQATGITLADWEAAKASLIARGMLNKAGAITPEGRNAIGNTRLGYSYFGSGEKPSLDNLRQGC